MTNPSEQRVRSRVRLDMAVRIRQIGPPRDLVEVARTLDVSRNGLLFCTRQPYNPHSTVWVTMPYNASAVVSEAEFPATVVRINRRADGFSEIGLQFHGSRSDQFLPPAQRAPQAAPARAGERRLRSRVRMGLPIRVRLQDSAEQSLTLDVSRSGVLFRTARHYPVGQTVWVAMPYDAGAHPQEMPARVVRVVEREDIRGVALQFTGEARVSARAF